MMYYVRYIGATGYVEVGFPDMRLANTFYYIMLDDPRVIMMDMDYRMDTATR